MFDREAEVRLTSPVLKKGAKNLITPFQREIWLEKRT